MLPMALKSCPKSNKSPNLATLVVVISGQCCAPSTLTMQIRIPPNSKVLLRHITRVAQNNWHLKKTILKFQHFWSPWNDWNGRNGFNDASVDEERLLRARVVFGVVVVVVTAEREPGQVEPVLPHCRRQDDHHRPPDLDIFTPRCIPSLLCFHNYFRLSFVRLYLVKLTLSV